MLKNAAVLKLKNYEVGSSTHPQIQMLCHGHSRVIQTQKVRFRERSLTFGSQVKVLLAWCVSSRH